MSPRRSVATRRLLAAVTSALAFAAGLWGCTEEQAASPGGGGGDVTLPFGDGAAPPADAQSEGGGDADPGDGGGGDGSSPGDGGNGDGGGLDAAVTFTQVYDSLIANTSDAGKINYCSQCHVGGHESNLDMSSKALAYANLVDAASAGSKCGDAGLTRVVPGQPSQSLMFLKVKPTPPCGDQMPAFGTGFLTQAEIDRIQAWIARGAPND